MTSQVDFTKTQNSRYLENETLFLLQIKKTINFILRATLRQIVLWERQTLIKNQFEPKQETLLKTLLIIHNIQ